MGGSTPCLRAKTVAAAANAGAAPSVWPCIDFVELTASRSACESQTFRVEPKVFVRTQGRRLMSDARWSTPNPLSMFTRSRLTHANSAPAALPFLQRTIHCQCLSAQRSHSDQASDQANSGKAPCGDDRFLCENREFFEKPVGLPLAVRISVRVSFFSLLFGAFPAAH